jgi:hypothetical protein
LEEDFDHFRPLPIGVQDLLDHLVNSPPPVSSYNAPHVRDPGFPISRSASAFPIMLKGITILAVGGHTMTINPSLFNFG